MNNTARKLFALLLCLVMVCSLLPVSALAEDDATVPEEDCENEPAPAEEDLDIPEEDEWTAEPEETILDSEGPSTDYVLTDDPRTDLVTVALAQKGKTASDFGFSVAWCSYFVSWCGRIAAPDLFPSSLQPYGKDLVVYMANNNKGVLFYFDDAGYASLNNGDPYVNFSTGNYVRTSRSSFTPEPGDLITFCNSEYEFKHIGIVCDVDDTTVYYIDGNGGGEAAGTTMTRPVRTYVPIARESSEISTYLRPNYDGESLSRGAGPNSFGWPVTNTKRINALDHYSSGAEHGGIDIAAANQSNVYSVAAGTVVRIGNGCSHYSSGSGHNCYSSDGWGEYGNYVVLRHSIGGTTYTSVYAHLTQNSILVSVGDTVSAGQQIAKSGSSGSSTGPHLHLEIYEGEFRGSIKTIRSKSFQYYLNNTAVLSGMTFSSHINTSSVYFGSWVEANCELVNGVWSYTGGGNQSDTNPPTISGAIYPSGTLTQGQSFGLRGIISSGSKLTNVSGNVYDSSGSAAMSYSTNPNSYSYNIQTDGLNSQFTFGTLSSGSYRYVVKATNSYGTATLIDSSFTIGTGSSGQSSVMEKLRQVAAEYPSGSYWTDSFDGASKSYGFAGMVIYRVFGKSTVSGKTYRWWNYAGESESGMVTVGQVTTCTEDNVKELLRSARPGDILQFDKGTDVRQHSMVIYSLTPTGLQVFECNWSADAECYVGLRELTFQELAARQTYGGLTRGTLSLLTSDNWNSINGSAYSCSIAYNAMGGTGAPSTQTKSHATALTLSSVTPSRANSTSGSYTVTLNANGGSVSTTSLTAARTTSYTFDSWNTSTDGDGLSYAPGASYTVNASATLYAQWNSSTSTAAVTLPTPTRTGYTFKGWATSSTAGSGTTGSYTPTGNVTLYAIWQANTYTVTYDANGGTGAPAAQTKTHDAALTLSTTQPTRSSASEGSYIVTLNANGGSVSTTSLTAARTTSYSFKNWNTAQGGGGASYAPGASFTVNANTTLYAQWNSSTSTAAVTLPTPTRDGYTFQGWATSADATSGTTGSYTPMGNVTLYAIWEQNAPETDAKFVVVGGRGRTGQEIQVPIRIEQNPGVVSIELSVVYDETLLEWTGVTAGEYGGIFDGAVGEALTWFAEDPAVDETGDGVFASLSFRVKADAPAGTTVVTVSYRENDIFNADEENQPFQIVPGEIEIFTYIPGDINGDGEVNNKDVTRLRRHLKHGDVEVVDAALDVNGDGEVNNKDVTRLMRYIKHGDVEIS